ncbi:MAG: Isoaspartyl aminopeptidase @ Asp-X dipeptidase [uncultured Solirubrobacteraceae bacterium]|uniref:Isoaspartyl aminopeptidase @ Asp-X dipeptidase n=1 Tax=uncultured Solirubrobacteraceae bacterium TaxID=1162706 RepID=A0A6J4RH44_9ACTN|nr:MAG: Isoaspartyl aminopeptidase @ Asp-X dipeptidase [uncultured Solirubrobacteraceae bacterium]
MSVVVVHGGAGTWAQADWPGATAAVAAAARAALGVIREGGSALDAAVAAVVILEDDPRFNAGTGAVPTEDGDLEHDAAVMDGATGRAGAVAAVRGIANPVRLARAVYEDGRHVLLAGRGAARFAEQVGLGGPSSSRHGAPGHPAHVATQDTVGAVVCLDGRLAAATSTGGIRGQRAGRVGDAPLIGAGTWADADCAVSATGHGERLIEAAAGHEVSARVRLTSASLQESVDAVLAGIRGNAGLIAVDARGRVAIACNTAAMPRAVATEREVRAATGRDEPLRP